MAKKPKVLFVYDHKYPEYWMDGLWAALSVLQGDFDIEKWNLTQGDPKPNDWDFLLGWGAFGSRPDTLLQAMSENKKGLCIAGNATPPTGADNYDVLFYETKWYRPQINFHKNIVHAFGVNTDIFFKSDIAMPIVFDYIGVGAFAKWKRWEALIKRPGTKLVVGEYQNENENESLEIVRNLVKGKVMVSNMVTPYDLANLYNWSRTLFMPSDINGGGERAVLEARACGLQVFILEDNPKLAELSVVLPIPDHKHYAAKLKEGILSVL